MFSSNSITELLGLCDKNLELTGKIFSEKVKDVEYKAIEAILTYSPEYCIHCLAKNVNKSIVKNGSQIVKVLINRVNNNPTRLHIKKQRFKCKCCNRTFMAETPITEKGCSISKAVKDSIVDNLAEIMPMKVIAKNHYVSSSTVARVLVSTEETKVHKWLPEAIGIDEFKSSKDVDGSMSVNIVDLKTGSIVDIVPDRRKFYLKEYFLSYPKEVRNQVKYISTDMYPTYIELGKELFKNAEIVLDKFHVVQLFTRNMNKLRINEMKRFKTYSHEYRVLKRYWKIVLAKNWELNGIQFYKNYCYKKLTNSRGIKEDILSFCERLKQADDFYQKMLWAINKKDQRLLNELLDRKAEEIPEYFRTSVESLKKYRKQVINAIETGYTNASVEGNNNLIKSFKRVSYGFRSFRNMKCRILLRNKCKPIKNSRFKTPISDSKSAA